MFHDFLQPFLNIVNKKRVGESLHILMELSSIKNLDKKRMVFFGNEILDPIISIYHTDLS